MGSAGHVFNGFCLCGLAFLLMAGIFTNVSQAYTVDNMEDMETFLVTPILEPSGIQLPVPMDDFSEAARITDCGGEAARLALLKAYDGPITEADVVTAVENAMSSNGSDTTFAFQTIVTSGTDSALPHGDYTDDSTNLIEPGEVVVIDWGAKKNGKCADETRTYFMGIPTEEMIAIYNLLLKAQDAARDTMKPGAAAASVDAAARRVICDGIYGPHFIHSLGHGYGAAVHEAPTLGPGSTETLYDGDTVTDEPGIYLQGEWGIRVEDDYRIIPGGWEQLTHGPRDLENATIYPPISFLQRGCACPGIAEIIVHDIDFNLDPLALDTVEVFLTSTTETVPEKLTLWETGVNSSVFKAQIQVEPGTPSPDGILQASLSDTLQAAYSDLRPVITRKSYAVVNNCLPLLSSMSVYAEPGYATIEFQTNEPTNATICYGKTSSLGSYARSYGYMTNHSVRLVNLDPDTAYYFDFFLWDNASNSVVCNNGSAHYIFLTMDGFSGSPGYDAVGYVNSDYPSDNYFTSIRMLSGYSTDSTSRYLGAMQFNTSTLPVGKKILRASVTIYGVGWEYSGSGSWQMKMLNGSVDANWENNGYSDISPAPSDCTLIPSLTSSDIVPRKWNTFEFLPGQLSLLEYRMSTGNVSFRLEGPSSGASLFYWATGFFDGCGAGDYFMPVLSVVCAPDSIVPETDFGTAVICLLMMLLPCILAGRFHS